MEQQTSTSAQSETNLHPAASQQGAFEPGSSVIYGMHGRCSVASIEMRRVSDQNVAFYKLEIQKPALSRSTRQEPAIWVPVATAIERGLRQPLSSPGQAEAVFKIFSSREYYFSLNEPWSVIQTKLESAIAREGAIGLAKTISYLFALRKKQIVATPEVNRLYDQANKVLTRELAGVLNEPIRAIEERVAKFLKQKLVPDS